MIELEGVTRTYRGRDGGTLEALAELSLRVGEGETLAVVGPSGCGKTTLLELVCGLQRPERGSVRCAPAALMPQRDLLLPWLDALDNAALALRIQGLARQRARETARPLFERFGLGGFERSHTHELSGGMRQRVALARTLLAGRPVLALDEPFASLDAITRAQMQDWLGELLEQERRTVLLVTHDVEEAVLLGDRVAVLSQRPGRLVAEMPVATRRPRRRSDPDVVGLRGRVLAALGVAA